MRRSLILLTAVVAACSGSGTRTTVLDDPADADVVVDAVYAEGFVSGVDPVVEVDIGDTVTISIVSDTPDELHIHGGYDLFVPLPRAEQVTFSFVADRLGVFAVELENRGEMLFELDVG